MMASLHRANVYSPTSSLSGSSFSMLASAPSSDDPFEAIDESSSDEDEIVWTANEFDPNEDFILIPQSHSLTGTTENDAQPPHEAFSRLSVRDAATPTPTTPTVLSRTCENGPKSKSLGCKGRRSAGARPEMNGQLLASTASAPAPKTHRGRRRRGRRDASASYPSPSPSPEREIDGFASPSLREGNNYQKGAIRFGAHPFVEESDEEREPEVAKYEDAVCFISSFLSNPSAALSCSTYTRLMFLQSLIIELGLISPTSALPSSLKSAKRFLKTRAFINIVEYLSVREQGLDKLQEIMFNSRKELTSDLKKKGGKKADRGWVKRHGLNVLLVSVF